MSFVVRRAVTFALPILMLPIPANAAPKVGTVTSSNSAVVARDGKVVPATPNMPLFPGDKLMTLPNGSANVSLGNQSMHLGNSSMMPMNAHPAILTMNSGSSFQGGDQFRRELLRRLAEFQRFIRELRCRQGFPHLQQIGFGGSQNFDDDDDYDHDNHHGPHPVHPPHPPHGPHDHDHCPVSP